MIRWADLAPRPGEDRWLVGTLLLFAATLPISIAVSETLAFLLVPLWIWRQARHGAPAAERHGLLLIAIFLTIALLASLMGLRPLHSLDKMLRFLLLVVALLIPLLARPGTDLLRRLALAFLAGTVLKAGFDVVRIPVGAWFTYQRLVAEGATTPDLPHAVSLADQALFSQGTMRDPQFYLVGLCLVVAAWATGVRRLRDPACWIPLLLLAGALVLHFKRGALMAAACVLLVMAVLSRRGRLLGALALVGLALAAVPQMRDRALMVRNEFTLSLQGRYPIWTQVAPGLLRTHPFGVGWKALRHEDLRKHSRHVQQGLNHLHNNALQVAVDFGWLGLGAWLAWMLAEGVRMARAWARRRAAGGPEAALALGVLCGFVGLMLVGVVEYNFGDTEIFMLLCLLWGLGAALARAPAAHPA